MNYYPFHIGDYRSATMHLSNAEDLAYRRALDWYYDTEQPLPLDTQWVARRLRVEARDLDTVLQDFFVRTGEGWVHERCGQEIAQFQQMLAKNRANGAKGGRPKKAVETDPQPVGWRPVGAGVAAATQPQGNQEPRTRNQEPEHPLAPEGAGGGTPPQTPAATPRHPVHPAHADHPSVRADPVDLPAPHALPRPTGDNSHPLAGTVCQLMKRLGVGLVNPGNAKLNALLNAGVGVGQFEDAAHKALAAGKSFSYALGIVEREEREARALGAQLQKPRVAAQPVNRQEALEARNRAVGDAWLQKMQAQAQVQTPTQTQMQMQMQMQTQGAGHAR